MRLSRRQLGAGAAGMLGCAGTSRESQLAGEILVSAQGDEVASFSLTGVTATGEALAVVPAGFRGHGSAVHPLHPELVVLCARRPGTSLLLVDLAAAAVVARVEAEAGTHFFGHGCFTPDGAWLYTTEADVAAGEGLVGVRDGRTLQLVEHLPSHGVGPHELRLLPDGETLVVANGGILTRPETGREKLNLDTMRSSLSYLDRRTGELLADHTLDEPKSSIRHLAVAQDGSVVVGVQAQREAMTGGTIVPLGARHRPGEPLEVLEGDEGVWRGFDDYVGSVAVNDRAGRLALTSPRGDRVGFWTLDSGRWEGSYEMRDVCGVTSTLGGRHFALSNSLGELRFLDAVTLVEDRARRIVSPGLRWDNHLTETFIA